MKHYRILISGGGTGGHIFPALAIANALRRRDPDTEILFVGAEGRMEMERVQKVCLAPRKYCATLSLTWP